MNRFFKRIGWLGLVIGLALGTTVFTPGSAQAAGAGDLIKCEGNSAVYLLAEDEQRYSFPNAKIYFSWYQDFDDVRTVSCENLAQINFGGVVNYRAGARLIKMPSVAVVYAVESNGVLRPIQSEAQAIELYGEGWAQLVDDIPESFFPRYTVGSALSEGELPEGMILQESDGSLLQVDEDGEAVEIDDVLTGEARAILQASARDIATVEARIGRTLQKIRDLESEIERLQRLIDRLKAVAIEDEDRVQRTIHVEDENGSETDVRSLPDFRVTDIELSAAGTVSATITNEGTADSPVDTDVYFWFDGVLEWTYNTSTLADRSMLTVGGVSTISPQRIFGKRIVRVCVDNHNKVAESQENDNCRIETLEAEDGDFDLTVTAVDAIDALGNPDELVRSFGFNVSDPMDHYRIRIWDASGNLHDEFTHQVNGSSVTAFYVSPGWLTPLSPNSKYEYEIHAVEHGTGDADTEKGEFETGGSAKVEVEDEQKEETDDPAEADKQEDETEESDDHQGADVDSDFDLEVTAVDAIDALGNADELVRSFGFKVSDPISSYVLHIYNEDGTLHDSYSQQISGTSPLSFYLSPSWLSPFTAGMQYDYELTATEQGTGATDTEKGTIKVDDSSSQESDTESESRETDSEATASATTLDASLHASSPSGAAVPSFREVLRFNLTAGSPNDAEVYELYFELDTTDNAQTNWNTCGAGSKGPFDDAGNFELRDSNFNNVATGFTFYNENGQDCNATSGFLTSMMISLSETVSAGSTETYYLYANTTGASAADDDTIMVNMPHVSEHEWYDGVSLQNGKTIGGLPVTGSVLTF